MSQIQIDLELLRKNGIYLMVPAYAGQCFAAFTRSMMQLSALCAAHQIPLDTFFIYNESLITRARNYCVEGFLNRKFRVKHKDDSITEHYYQHAMFIDTDIEFNAIDVLVMAHLQATNPEYDVLCGPYPKKVLSYEKIKYAVDKGLADDNPQDLEKFVGDYVFNTTDNKPIKLNEPAQVAESGTGFMMIRRDVFSKIDKKFPDIKYLPDHSRSEGFDGSKMISAYFDTSIDPKSKRYLSEDYHFCRLCEQSGQKVWLVPWFELKHHGYFVYGGSLLSMANAGIPATVDPSMLKKKR